MARKKRQPRKNYCVTRAELGKEIAYILQLPFPSPRYGPAHDILNAIIKTIEDALLRGEEVKISGFGIFKIRTRKPIKKGVKFFYHPRNKDAKQVTITTKEKKYIFFEPSRVLLKMLNEDQNESQSLS